MIADREGSSKHAAEPDVTFACNLSTSDITQQTADEKM